MAIPTRSIGEPKSKPKGSKHKATLAVSELLDGEVEALTRKAVELALEGDTAALKMCLDCIAPTLKPVSSAVNLDMPPPNNLADTAKAFINAAGKGELAPDIAAQMVSAIANVARVEEIETLKHRLESLEHAIKGAN